MTSCERVQRTIRHESTDRLPYCITMVGSAWQKLGITSCRSQDDYFGNDVIKIAPPWWQWHNAQADWRAMEAPRGEPPVIGSGSYTAFTEAVNRAHDDGKYALAIIYGSHFEKANSLRGIENFLADMGCDLPFARRLLTKIIDRNLIMLENILAVREIDGVLLGSDWGSQQDLLISPDTWHDLIAPGEKREYDLIHSYGKDVWIHSCGNILKIIPSLIEMGVDVLNPVQPECMDIEALKREFGQRITFWGGVSTQRTLPYGTPDDVRRESRLVKSILGSNGGYVFSPAQELQEDVPRANIEALIDVAREAA